MASQRFNLIVAYIASVDQYAAFSDIVQARNQLNQGAFAGACTADHSDGLTRLCIKIDVCQDIIWMLRIIFEGDMIKFHIAFDCVFLCVRGIG